MNSGKIYWTMLSTVQRVHKRLFPEKLENQYYTKMQKFIEQSEYASEQKRLDYQMRKLQETCQYAYKNIPYYKKLFDESGFNADKFKYFDYLEKIPFLTKEMIQKNISDLVSTVLPRRELYYFTTGGSTGIPMGLYHGWSMAVKERAYINNMWQRVGYEPGKRLAILRGQFTGKPIGGGGGG
ncbi:MAG: hypothetical protein LBL79_12540, partial [Prevotella sp.]|nr:hypothetical protein [Prevotella sp.]